MKKIYLSISIICMAIMGVMAQAPACSPIGSCDTICPDPQVDLIAQTNAYYSETITLSFDTTGIAASPPVPGFIFIIDSVVIRSVTGLPIGIDWTTACGFESECNMALTGLNCMTFSGTPTSTGIYNVLINYDAYASDGSGMSIPGETDPYEYTLRVTETPLRFNRKTTDASELGTCDGAATVSVTGGTAPYTFNWSSGEVTSSVSGKCSDKYTFVATDSKGITDSTYVYISEPSYSYNTCPPHATPPSDTIITDLDTCIIDYNYPIDSVAMTSYTQTDSTNAIIDFEVYQNGQKVTFSANVKYDSIGMTFIELNLHCAGTFAKALRTTTIQGGIDFQYSNIGIKQDVITTSIADEESSGSSAVVYPNPFTDNLTVEVAKASTVTVSDANGKVISTQSVSAGSTTINTGNYSSGVYLITITGDEVVTTKKMIKE